MNESLGFMGCSFLRPGTVQRAAWQSNVDVATWAPAPYEVIRRPFIEKEEHPQNQSITSLFVGYYFRRRRRNRPSNRTQRDRLLESQKSRISNAFGRENRMNDLFRQRKLRAPCPLASVMFIAIRIRRSGTWSTQDRTIRIPQKR